MPFPFARPCGTAAALPNNGGTAAGSVGVAVPLSLLAVAGFAFAALTRACQIGAAVNLPLPVHG